MIIRFPGAAPRKAGGPPQVWSGGDWLDRARGAAPRGAGVESEIPASETVPRDTAEAAAASARHGETNLIDVRFPLAGHVPVLGLRTPRNAGMRWPHRGIRFLILPSTRNKRTDSAAL